MHSLYFSNFLFKKVQETISLCKYVKEVSIDCELNESFGNEYIRVNYSVSGHEEFENLPVDEHYIFQLSTHAERGRHSKRRKLLRIVEFKNIYESLAAYAVLQFESSLNNGTAIKVKGIDMWPEINYAEKNLNEALNLKKGFEFEYDTMQWHRLHRLANESKKVYTNEQRYFNVTDAKINKVFGIEIKDIRFLLLRNNVSIKLKGVKTIDQIQIHALKLVTALRNELIDKYFSRNEILYKHLISYLYDYHLIAEKVIVENNQKKRFLEHFEIQIGDIIQLKDERVVIVNSTEINTEYEIIIEYSILKSNLEVSARRRKIASTLIAYVLKEKDFLEYKSFSSSKRLSLLDKWMLKRKKKIHFLSFKPDLTSIESNQI